MYDILVPVDTSTKRALDQARTVTDLPLAGDVHAVVFSVFTGENTGGATVSWIVAARQARDHLLIRSVMPGGLNRLTRVNRRLVENSPVTIT